MDFLRERVRAAADGEGGVVLISGEPGIGKSRLMLDAAAEAEAEGWRVLAGHAYDSEGTPPYLPFLEAIHDLVSACSLEELRSLLGEGGVDVALLMPELRGLLPELTPGPDADPEIRRYRLLDSVSDFLAAIARSAESGGLVLCLDDLHWADDATLLLLEHLARHPAPVPFLILATYRDTDLDVSHPLARTLDHFTRQRLAVRIDLKELDRDDVGALLGSLGRPDPPSALVDAVFDETDGNPFFVLEVFEYLAGQGRLFDEAGGWRHDAEIGRVEVPQGVRLVIGRRLERLSEECRRVLALAAVIGRTFRYDLLRSLAGVEEEALFEVLEEAERLNVITSDVDGRLTFIHELVRQTVLTGISAPRRIRWHQQVGLALEARHGERLEEHAAEIAEHFSQGAEPAVLHKAVHYGQMAAARAMQVFAYSEAVAFLERCLSLQELVEVVDNTVRCDLLLSLGEALMPAGQPLRASEEVAEEAFSLAEALGDRERASRACSIGLGGLVDSAGVQVYTTPAYRLWARRADTHALPETVARVYADIAIAQVLHGEDEWGAAWPLQEGALALARRLGDPAALFQAARFIIRPPQTPDRQEARLCVAQEFISRDRGGVPARTLEQIYFQGHTVFLDWGLPGLADGAYQKLVELAARTRHPSIERRAHGLEAVRALFAGELEVTADFVGIGASPVRPGGPVYWRGLLHLGCLEEPPALPTADGPHDALEVFDAGLRALWLGHVGRPEEARIELHRLLERDSQHTGGGRIPYDAYIVLLETAVVTKDLEAAEVISGRLSSLAGRAVGFRAFTSVGRHLGTAALLLGKPDQAREYYLQALAGCELIAFRPEVALIRLQLAELLFQHYPAERASAAQHLEFAIAEFEAMKMAPSLERALRLRGRRRPAPEPRAPQYPDGLSDREAEVLRLIAAGRSNQQIADDLFISQNTVFRHVSHILTKTGSVNRTEAASYAHRHGLA